MKPQNVLIFCSDEHQRRAMGAMGHGLVGDPQPRQAGRARHAFHAGLYALAHLHLRARLAGDRNAGARDALLVLGRALPRPARKLDGAPARTRPRGGFLRQAALPLRRGRQRFLRGNPAHVSRQWRQGLAAGPGSRSAAGLSRGPGDGARCRARREQLHRIRPRHCHRGLPLAQTLSARHQGPALGALRLLRQPALPFDRAAALLRSLSRADHAADGRSGRGPGASGGAGDGPVSGITTLTSTRTSRDRAKRGYFGLCSFLDDNIGQVLAALEDSGRRGIRSSFISATTAKCLVIMDFGASR